MSGLTRILVLGGLVLAAVLVFGSPCLLRGWMRKLAGVALGVLVLCATSLLGYGAYRRWLDDVRVANVNTIYQVIERYKETTGKCPLQERFVDAPMGVNISDRPLPDRYKQPPPGAKGSIIPYEDFLAELRTGLKSEVILPKDPQTVPFGPPNFYQYHFTGPHFFVAASLWFDRAGVKQLGSRYYKYELRGDCGSSGKA